MASHANNFSVIHLCICLHFVDTEQGLRARLKIPIADVGIGLDLWHWRFWPPKKFKWEKPCKNRIFHVPKNILYPSINNTIAYFPNFPDIFLSLFISLPSLSLPLSLSLCFALLSFRSLSFTSFWVAVEDEATPAYVLTGANVSVTLKETFFLLVIGCSNPCFGFFYVMQLFPLRTL